MSERILVIEDNEQDFKVIHRCLKQAGYADVAWAQTAKEGIAIVKEFMPDVVIIDMVLPDSDGYTVCHQLSSLHEKKMRLILTTGVLQVADALKARGVGADEFVLKEPDRLLKRKRL